MEKIEKISLHDALVEQQVNFVKKLIGNALDLKRHIDIASVEPSYTRPDQMGRPIAVKEMIESYKKGIENCKHYLKIINDLLSAKDDVALESKIDELAKYEVKIIIPNKKEIHGK